MSLRRFRAAALAAATAGATAAAAGTTAGVVAGAQPAVAAASSAEAVAVASSATSTAAADTVTVPASGTITVHGRGNGHGHGMSQYGAQGAALAGRTTAQILAFYYPHTTAATTTVARIRVRIAEATPNTTVLAGTGTLSVTGHGALPASGYASFRLVPSGTGLAVQGRATGSSRWTPVATGLPARADFSGTAGWVQLLLADGTSTRYHGTVGALRSGSGEITINSVSLDDYTAGVVPREMPASWLPAAVAAQAVAARTYGANAVQSSTGDSYDICDTSQCQVYGGMAHFSASGTTLWTDDAAAVTGDRGEILTYDGAAIFAQYSASDGGATVSGGEPYLVGKVDPYDDSASGDPYLDWSRRVPVSGLAAYYGMTRVTSIRVTRRDGHGAWGGRVVTAAVTGTPSSGASTTVTTTGIDLASALDVLTPLLHIDGTSPSMPSPSTPAPPAAGPVPQPVTALSPSRLFDSRATTPSVSAAHPFSFVVAGRGGIPATGAQSAQLSLSVLDATASGTLLVYSSGARATPAAAVPYAAGQRTTVTVSVPLTPSATVVFAPSAGTVSLLADALSWTGRGGAALTPTTPTPVATVAPAARFGAGGAPISLAKLSGVTGAVTAVVLSVQAWTTRPGIARVRIWPDGTPQRSVLDAVAGPRSVSANTVVVPLPSSRRLRLAVDDAGVGVHVTLLGTVGPGSGGLVTFPESGVAGPSVPGHPQVSVGTTATTVPVAGVGALPASGASAVLLHATATGTRTGGRVWIWPAGTSRPLAPTLRFGPRTPTQAATMVRLGSAGTVQVVSSVPGVTLALAADGYVTG